MKMVDTKKRTTPTESAGGVRVNRTGRRTFTLEYKLAVVKECGPGTSVAAVALQHRINANLLRRWIVRHGRALLESKPQPQPTMLPVTIEAASAAAEVKARERSCVRTRRRASGTTIEIEIYGARIHLHGDIDAQALQRVLEVLAQR
jgi:transposase-like protein